MNEEVPVKIVILYWYVNLLIKSISFALNYQFIVGASEGLSTSISGSTILPSRRDLNTNRNCTRRKCKVLRAIKNRSFFFSVFLFFFSFTWQFLFYVIPFVRTALWVSSAKQSGKRDDMYMYIYIYGGKKGGGQHIVNEWQQCVSKVSKYNRWEDVT